MVLFEPAIPQNTGAVARQCVGMDAALHLIKPMKFEVTDHAVKRAGLDYWPHLRLTIHEDRNAFLDWLGDRQPWLVTKFGTQRYDEPAYAEGDVLILGNENRGLPEDWHTRWPGRGVVVPMLGPVRSFNLSNTAAIVLAEASRKSGRFEG